MCKPTRESRNFKTNLAKYVVILFSILSNYALVRSQEVNFFEGLSSALSNRTRDSSYPLENQGNISDRSNEPYFFSSEEDARHNLIRDNYLRGEKRESTNRFEKNNARVSFDESTDEVNRTNFMMNLLIDSHKKDNMSTRNEIANLHGFNNATEINDEYGLNGINKSKEFLESSNNLHYLDELNQLSNFEESYELEKLDHFNRKRKLLKNTHPHTMNNFSKNEIKYNNLDFTNFLVSNETNSHNQYISNDFLLTDSDISLEKKNEISTEGTINNMNIPNMLTSNFNWTNNTSGDFYSFYKNTMESVESNKDVNKQNNSTSEQYQHFFENTNSDISIPSFSNDWNKNFTSFSDIDLRANENYWNEENASAAITKQNSPFYQNSFISKNPSTINEYDSKYICSTIDHNEHMLSHTSCIGEAYDLYHPQKEQEKNRNEDYFLNNDNDKTIATTTTTTNDFFKEKSIVSKVDIDACRDIYNDIGPCYESSSKDSLKFHIPKTFPNPEETFSEYIMRKNITIQNNVQVNVQVDVHLNSQNHMDSSRKTNVQVHTCHGTGVSKEDNSQLCSKNMKRQKKNIEESRMQEKAHNYEIVDVDFFKSDKQNQENRELNCSNIASTHLDKESLLNTEELTVSDETYRRYEREVKEKEMLWNFILKICNKYLISKDERYKQLCLNYGMVIEHNYGKFRIENANFHSNVLILKRTFYRLNDYHNYFISLDECKNIYDLIDTFPFLEACFALFSLSHQLHYNREKFNIKEKIKRRQKKLKDLVLSKEYIERMTLDHCDFYARLIFDDISFNKKVVFDTLGKIFCNELEVNKGNEGIAIEEIKLLCKNCDTLQNKYDKLYSLLSRITQVKSSVFQKLYNPLLLNDFTEELNQFIEYIDSALLSIKKHLITKFSDTNKFSFFIFHSISVLFVQRLLVDSEGEETSLCLEKLLNFLNMMKSHNIINDSMNFSFNSDSEERIYEEIEYEDCLRELMVYSIINLFRIFSQQFQENSLEMTAMISLYMECSNKTEVRYHAYKIARLSKKLIELIGMSKNLINTFLFENKLIGIYTAIFNLLDEINNRVSELKRSIYQMKQTYFLDKKLNERTDKLFSKLKTMYNNASELASQLLHLKRKQEIIKEALE